MAKGHGKRVAATMRVAPGSPKNVHNPLYPTYVGVRNPRARVRVPLSREQTFRRWSQWMARPEHWSPNDPRAWRSV